MKKHYILFSFLFLSQIVFSQIDVNACALSQNIAVSENPTTIDFEISNVAITSQLGCDGTTLENTANLWYDFTMPFTGNVYIDANIDWNNIALYDACNGTQIHCGSSSAFFRELTPGTNYKLRIFRTAETAPFDSNLDFTITAFKTPFNDNCSTSKNIIVTTASETISFDFNGAVVTNEITCNDTTTEDIVDLWYHFTMPVNGNLEINPSSYRHKLALYNACGDLPIQCSENDSFFVGLTAGSEYKLRISETPINPYTLNSSFYTKVYETPENDNCANSENISLLANIPTTISAVISGATFNDEEGCSTNDLIDDVWYDFTMPFDGGVEIIDSRSYTYDFYFALYDACGGNKIYCGRESEIITALTAGSNYKLRIFRRTPNPNSDKFINFTVTAFNTTPNYDCATSQHITISTTPTTVPFQIDGTTLVNNTNCNNVTSEASFFWYDFIMPINGDISVNGNIWWNSFELFDTCSGTAIACGPYNFYASGLTAGTNYKLKLKRSVLTADNFSYFSIVVFENPANEDCATSQNITVSETTSTVDFTIGGADFIPGPDCAGGEVDDFADVWFDFTMPFNGSVYISSYSSDQLNIVEFYDTCGGTPTDCNDTQLIKDLVAGTNYKIKISRTADNALIASDLSFNITAYNIPPNDICSNAQNIIVSTTSSTVDFSITSAAINNEMICNTSYLSNYADIWYDFTMPINGNLYLNSSSTFATFFELYESCSSIPVQCGVNDPIFQELISGTNYKLRIVRQEDFTHYASNSNNSFSIKAIENVTNNNCSTSQNIAVTTAENRINYSFTTTTSSNEILCNTATIEEYANLWYDFTMPVNGNVHLDAFHSNVFITLYDNCSGTQLYCGNNEILFSELNAGTSYKLKISRLAENTSTPTISDFHITAYESVSNDDCSTAENIVVTTLETAINYSILGARVNYERSCVGTTEDYYLDIWYQFTMPIHSNLYIDYSSYTNIAVYDACDGTEIYCGNNKHLFSGLIAGTNYKLKLFRSASQLSAPNIDFSIQAIETSTNDDCASAENINVSTTESIVDFTIIGATITNEIGCNNTAAEDYVDIWYDFTMPVNGNLKVNADNFRNNIAIYNACGGVQLECGNANETFVALTSGTNYKLRIFRTAANADDTNYLSFSIQAIAFNDDCESAENIPVTTTVSNVTMSFIGASITNEMGCEGTPAQDYADIWYEFTMPVNGNLNIDAELNLNYLALYDACGGTQMLCGNDEVLFTGLSAGANYKLRVFRTAANASLNFFTNFTIQAIEVIDNDDCTSAENITITNTPTTVNFGIAGANINNEIGCSGTTAEDYVDIWYDFTMPIDGYILIDGSINWNNFALYDACSGNELSCFSSQGYVAGLTNGTTYKLRVFRTLALASNEEYKSFTIQSTETLSTNDTALENSIRVYPNPASNQITIAFPLPIERVRFYDLLGKLILQEEGQNTINISELSIGIYILKIQTSMGIVSKKIVKK